MYLSWSVWKKTIYFTWKSIHSTKLLLSIRKNVFGEDQYNSFLITRISQKCENKMVEAGIGYNWLTEANVSKLSGYSFPTTNTCDRFKRSFNIKTNFLQDSVCSNQFDLNKQYAKSSLANIISLPKYMIIKMSKRINVTITQLPTYCA